jgi:hypothetical protein
MLIVTVDLTRAPLASYNHPAIQAHFARFAIAVGVGVGVGVVPLLAM